MNYPLPYFLRVNVSECPVREVVGLPYGISGKWFVSFRPGIHSPKNFSWPHYSHSVRPFDTFVLLLLRSDPPNCVMNRNGHLMANWYDSARHNPQTHIRCVNWVQMALIDLILWTQEDGQVDNSGEESTSFFFFFFYILYSVCERSFIPLQKRKNPGRDKDERGIFRSRQTDNDHNHFPPTKQFIPRLYDICTGLTNCWMLIVLQDNVRVELIFAHPWRIIIIIICWLLIAASSGETSLCIVFIILKLSDKLVLLRLFSCHCPFGHYTHTQ